MDTEENESREQGAATGTREAPAVNGAENDSVEKDGAEKDSGEEPAAAARSGWGEKVARLGESAEGTLEHAKARTVRAKERIAAYTGPWAARVRETAPKVAREQGRRAVKAAEEHPKGAMAGVTALGVFAMALLRRTRRALSRPADPREGKKGKGRRS